MKYKFFALLTCICLWSDAAFSKPKIKPRAPTSADNITLILASECHTVSLFGGNLYDVSMQDQTVIVTLGVRARVALPGCPPSQIEYYPFEVDIGRLPAGKYKLLMRYQWLEDNGTITKTDYPEDGFVVTSAREQKNAPYPMRNYSGTYWDPSDPGSGVTIWQNQRGNKDELLVTWFSYDSTGQAVWYSFDPTWSSPASTNTVPVYRIVRNTSASQPNEKITRSLIGTARLVFIGLDLVQDNVALIYQLNNEAMKVKFLRRYDPECAIRGVCQDITLQ
jgi:hypothetical protein